MRELPGPQNYQQWTACWKVFKTAAIMLGIVSLAALLNYEKLIERLVVQWPMAWGLVCQADDKARAERLERIRRNFVVDQAAGKSMPTDWDPDSPWTTCFRALTSDEVFWNEQVRHPAVSWMAAGGKGAPVAAAEAIAGAHFVGTESGPGPGGSDVVDRKKQANRDKRAAKKKRVQEQREELQRLKAARRPEATVEGGKKGTSKGKSKDQAGLQLCYSWATGTGPCADVPPGGECKCQVKRLHKCQFCLSPSHRNDACPLK